MEIALAEWVRLKNEIENRSQAQLALTSLYLTAAGILGGVAFARDGDGLVLLVLPFIAVAVGLLWLDHANTVFTISKYIAGDVHRCLTEAIGDDRFPMYEREFHEPRLNAEEKPQERGALVRSVVRLIDWMIRTGRFGTPPSEKRNPNRALPGILVFAQALLFGVLPIGALVVVASTEHLDAANWVVLGVGVALELWWCMRWIRFVLEDMSRSDPTPLEIDDPPPVVT